MQQVRTCGKSILSDEILSLKKAAAEAVWIGLRRSQGIDGAWFQQRFKQSILSYFQQDLEPWLQSGHLIWQDKKLQLTDKGIPLTDAVASTVF